MSKRKLLFIVPLLIAALSTVLAAQSIVSGDVTGTVTDPSGAIVPNTALILTSDATGAQQTSSTNSGGLYRFPLLKPGSYTLKVNASGFQPLTQKIVVAVGQATTANVKLQLAGANQTVEVTGQAPVIQTENGNISTSFDTRQIQALPSPGNDITYVAQTAPGITASTASGGGFGNFTAFGLPANANLFTINGNDEMDPYLNLNNSGASNLTIGANELQEATVVNNGYTGQYGRQVGAQVNYVTKSGTDQFHGNAIYYYNGRVLNANDWFNNHSGTPRPFVNDNQWAASLGGPVPFTGKNTFFFLDTEGLRIVLPTTQATFVPSPQFQSFVLANLATANPGAIPFYNRIFNLYNGAAGVSRAVPVDSSQSLGCGGFTGLGAGVPCANTFRSIAGNLSREWEMSARVDHNFGANDKLFARFKTDHGVQPTFTDPINPLFDAFSTQPQYEGQLNETHVIGSNAANEFIASGSWYSAIFNNANPAATLAAFPTELDFPLFTSLGGENRLFPQGRKVAQYQFVDDVSVTKGDHTIKFGGNFRRNDVTDLTFGVFTSGAATEASSNRRGDALTQFANGTVSSFRQRFPLAQEQPIAIYSLGLYAQDEWRVSSNLKLTLALRADRNSNAVCQRNCFSRFTAPFQQLPHDATGDLPFNSVIQTGLHRVFPRLEAVAWQPRIGFAYTPWTNSNTVIRGGAGIFSDLYPGVLVDRFATNSPNENEFRIAGAGLSPDVPGNAFATAAASNAAFLNQFFTGGTLNSIRAAVPGFRAPNFNDVNRRITNPKFAEYNLELQQGFGNHSSISLNYVGNHGYDIFILNPGLNAFCDAGTCPTSFGGLPSAAPDARFQSVINLRNRAVSNYNGLTATFQHQFSAGLQVKAGYTYSHDLDEISNGGIPNTPFSFNTSLAGQLDPFNLHRLNYGNADYDVRHSFTASYVYESPFKFSNGFVNEVLGGWTVSGAFFTHSGLPYTVIDSGAPFAGVVNNFTIDSAILPSIGGFPTQSCNSPDRNCLPAGLFPTTAVGSGINLPGSGAAITQNGFGNQHRNQFRAASFFDTDLALLKNFKLTERLGFAVGANFFNILNHPNFSSPIFDVSASNFGSIQNTAEIGTSPYGSFVGAAASARIVQVNGRLTF